MSQQLLPVSRNNLGLRLRKQKGISQSKLWVRLARDESHSRKLQRSSTGADEGQVWTPSTLCLFQVSRPGWILVSECSLLKNLQFSRTIHNLAEGTRKKGKGNLSEVCYSNHHEDISVLFLLFSKYFTLDARFATWCSVFSFFPFSSIKWLLSCYVLCYLEKQYVFEVSFIIKL